MPSIHNHMREIRTKREARKLDPHQAVPRQKEHPLGSSITTAYLPGMIVETLTEVTQAIIKTTVTTTIFRKDLSPSVIGPIAPSPPDKVDHSDSWK